MHNKHNKLLDSSVGKFDSSLKPKLQRLSYFKAQQTRKYITLLSKTHQCPMSFPSKLTSRECWFSMRVSRPGICGKHHDTADAASFKLFSLLEMLTNDNVDNVVICSNHFMACVLQDFVCFSTGTSEECRMKSKTTNMLSSIAI
eukprot:scaffold261773_cov15-Tisochrysis_lutea.AAC.1